MESFGAMWLDTGRAVQGRNALSVELLYVEDDENGLNNAAERVRTLLDLRVRVLLRVDWRHGQTVPAAGDYEGKWTYAHYFGETLAQHPDLRRVHGFIVGNEPNLKAENSVGPEPGGIPAEWYMQVHSGARSELTDEADVHTQLRASGYTGDVLIAAVAPWAAQADGILDFYPTPPGATGTMAWHRYASTLYWLAYGASRMPREEVKGAVHTYSNVMACQELGLNPALEPTYADELRHPEWNSCQYGIRVYDELLEQMRAQAGGQAVPHYVTEWNSLVGREQDDLSDPAWPCNNYPSGLLHNALSYLKSAPDLLGFAVFVDQNMGDSCPFWLASSARGHLKQAQLNAEQQFNLRQWDAEMDQVFQTGW